MQYRCVFSTNDLWNEYIAKKFYWHFKLVVQTIPLKSDAACDLSCSLKKIILLILVSPKYVGTCADIYDLLILGLHSPKLCDPEKFPQMKMVSSVFLHYAFVR